MKKIAELRKERNLSQSELAEKIGVSQQTISKYEKGIREPDISTLLSLSKIFNVSIDFLLENNVNKLSNNFSISVDERELLSYYKQLNRIDKRWIMGQIIDLIKKSNEDSYNIPKVQ